MHRIPYSNGVVAYSFESFTSLPLQAHVSARHGGVSPHPWRSLNFSYSRGDERARVLKNFARFCAALGQDPSQPVRTHQVHSASVSRVDWKDAGSRQKDCDALITNAVGLPSSWSSPTACPWFCTIQYAMCWEPAMPVGEVPSAVSVPPH